MAEQIRSYEVSIWTLQDSFVTVLKPSELEHKGQIQNGIVEFADDGTEKFDFSIPMYYYEKDQKIINPLWNYVLEGHLVANMHKIKLIFNKATEDEAVYEFLVISVIQRHEQDSVMYEISCEGLAFHELGKLGYKIYLSGDDFVEEYTNWFKYDQADGVPAPRQTIQYWNDKVFYYKTYEGEKHQKYDWTYEINMDWSDCSSVAGQSRDPHKVYEEEFVTSWEVDVVNDELFPTNVENFKEKWRAVDIEESNIYNITQTIAEKFGVYCRYEYEHDDNYHIIGKKVIYYNNNYQDSQKHIDITYPYNTSSVSRIIDNAELATKLFVRPVESETSSSNIISISTVDANKSKEDYILNFDYLRKINSITEDQYDAIKEFEFKIARINDRITHLDTQIRMTEEKLVTAEADEALYTSAITLDKERINNANMLKSQLTGEDEVIMITEDNPEMLLLRSANDSVSNDLRQVKLPFEGILPESVKLYKKLNYTKKSGEGRLTGSVPTGDFQYDEYNNPVSITNIYITDNTKKLYMTCSYSPKLYYNQVEQTWMRRLADDEVKLADAEERVAKFNLLLYGCDVGYALADYAKVEFVSAGTSIADYVIGHNQRGQEIGEYGTYLGEAILEEAHGYILMREIFLLKKTILVTKFEKMMGPALREGYWTPEDYDDYGNKYGDLFRISDNTEFDFPGSVRPDIINFTWDTTNIFYGESKLYYELGVTQDKNYYLLIDLTRYLDRIKNYIDNLSFIYYDQTFINLNDELARKDMRQIELNERQTLGTITADERLELAALQLTEENRIVERQRNIKNALRWFTVGANCEFTFVKYNGTIRPVLMVTGIKDLTSEQLYSIYTNLQGYEPYLGIVETEVIEEKKEEKNEEGKIEIKTYRRVEIKTTKINFNNENLVDDYLNVGIRETTKQEEYQLLVRAGMGVFLDLGKDNSYSMAVADFWNLYYANPTYYESKNKLTMPLTSCHQIGYFVGKESETGAIDIDIAYPRIRIDSLDLNQDTVLLAVNRKQIETPQDFYILIEDDKVDDTEKSFITIKPSVFMKIGEYNYSIDIDYALSNAAEAIYLDALKVSKENAYPQVSYEVELNMLNKDMIRTAYSLLRRVIYINDVDLLFDDVAGYISRITLNLDKPWEDSVEIKNYETKFEDLFSTIVAQTESMKKSESVINFAAAAFSTGGVINSSVLQESMLKADLTYAFNQGTLTIDEKKGIWATSDAGVVAIRGGGIFTATEKETNGQWKWNTGILPSGINADIITTGQLDTNKINIYAGDKVRFQMNGQGLFAYKALFSEQIIMDDDSQEYATYINSKNGDIDASQYITYNENGMYLVAKKGALVLNPNKNGYIEVGKDEENNSISNFPDELHRVEISWDGLKLRDWNNKLVFFADPNNGNLTLRGNIETYGGIIGNWHIDENSLYSNQISLISAGTSPGIYLTARDSGLVQAEYNGLIYTAYNIIYDASVAEGERDTTDYYFNNNEPTITINNSNTKCLKYQNAVTSVTPIITIVDNGKLYIADPTTSNPRVAITYQGNRIEYNGLTSPTSVWYQTTLSAVAAMNNRSIDEFVTQETGYTLAQTTLSVGTRLELASFAPTFSVLAQTGEVNISNGTLGVIGSGGFTLKPNGLYNGNLNAVNINVNSNIMVGSSAHSIGNCFDGFKKYDDESGFTLYRVGGHDPINFNIAGTTYFKNAISAATVIATHTVSKGPFQSNSITTVYAQAAGFNGICSAGHTQEVNTGEYWDDGWTKGYRKGEEVGANNVTITSVYTTGNQTYSLSPDWGEGTGGTGVFHPALGATASNNKTGTGTGTIYYSVDARAIYNRARNDARTYCLNNSHTCYTGTKAKYYKDKKPETEATEVLESITEVTYYSAPPEFPS